MPKAPPPSVLLKFQGRRDYPLDKENDDWGLTPEQQESYVEQFRRGLAAKGAWKEDEHDYYYLRRFLRARTYDLEKATLMWLNHMKWMQEFQVGTILEDFYFNERDAFIEAYPQGYHKIDKLGRPVYVQMLGKINMAAIKKVTTEERMLKFHIQEYERCRKVILPICSQLAGRHIDQTFGIMDVKGVGMGHLTGEVKRLMAMVMQYDQDNYPEMLGHICIINAPAVFRMLWSVVKGYIDIRTQQKIEILGPQYKDALLKWVEEDNLQSMWGGTSEGTLQDDKGPWNEPEVMTKLGLDVEDLKRRALPPPPPPGMFPPESLGLSTVTATATSTMHSPTIGRNHTLQNADSFQSAVPHDWGAASTSSRNLGVTQELVDEAMRNNTASKPKATLVERIVALERVFPAHMERLKANIKEEGKSRGVNISGGISTHSAPDGSLLNRVEVLEEGMAALLLAQEESLAYQQAMLTEAQQREVHKKAESGCCLVM